MTREPTGATDTFVTEIDIEQSETVKKLRAEIERHMREKVALAGLVTKERDDNERLQAICFEVGCLRIEIARLTAENARLKEIEIKFDQFISGAFV